MKENDFSSIFNDLEEISKMLVGLKKSIEKTVNSKLSTVS